MGCGRETHPVVGDDDGPAVPDVRGDGGVAPAPEPHLDERCGAFDDVPAVRQHVLAPVHLKEEYGGVKEERDAPAPTGAVELRAVAELCVELDAAPGVAVDVRVAIELRRGTRPYARTLLVMKGRCPAGWGLTRSAGARRA